MAAATFHAITATERQELADLILAALNASSKEGRLFMSFDDAAWQEAGRARDATQTALWDRFYHLLGSED